MLTLFAQLPQLTHRARDRVLQPLLQPAPQRLEPAPEEGEARTEPHEFLGDGGTKDGKDQGDAQVTEAQLRDLFAPPYEAAIKAGVQKGQVHAVLTIDEKGNVADVKITQAEPARVFDRVVRETLTDWKCAADGTKYQASVEINFTLKDE